MKTELLSAYLETNDNSFVFNGYNLTHRLQPLMGTKLKVESVFKFLDPTTGRNIDRVVLKFYDDSFFVEKTQKELNREVIQLKKELKESLSDTKIQMEQNLKEKIARALEKTAKASEKLEEKTLQLESKNDDVRLKMEKEFKYKIKALEDFHKMECKKWKDENYKLTLKLEKFETNLEKNS